MCTRGAWGYGYSVRRVGVRAVTLQIPDIIGKCFTRVCPDIIDGFPLEVHETVVDDVMYVERVHRTLLHDQDRVEDSDKNEKRA